ncbi:MAG: FAD-binding oxidoreductase [Pseudomonadota bacterium]
MTSISGKTTLDWVAFADALAPIETLSEAPFVKKRSRDCFWYSPILDAELKKSFGDLVVLPKDTDELRRCLQAAYSAECPVVIRGGGTGNYGQAVPVEGGLIVDVTNMNQILEIGDGYVRVQAGAIMADINSALKETGQEMTMFPSTYEIATIGGFVAGGSVGIGSLANGALREPGNLIALKAMSVEGLPIEQEFTGPDVLKIHHAWGLNGVITEVTLRTVPAKNWVACMATCPSYQQTYATGYALATAENMGPKMVSVVEARITDYFPRLEGHITKGQHLLVAYVPDDEVDAYRSLMQEQGLKVELTLTDEERIAAKIPHAFEFSFNHTTLQVLKSDRSATYQQIGVPDPADAAAIGKLHAEIGDDVWIHNEFYRLGGEVVAIDLPIIWYKDEARLQEINETYLAHGFGVYDAHSNQVERGGLHSADYTHLAWKKRLDPKGLLNSAKSIAWDMVKHLTPEEIEQKSVAK